MPSFIIPVGLKAVKGDVQDDCC